jgi:hypothetical protein
MRKLIAALAGGLLMAVIAIPGLSGGAAFAFTNGGGNSGNAPGQANAYDNCIENLAKQYANDVIPDNGAHAGDAATNCDHFWN